MFKFRRRDRRDGCLGETPFISHSQPNVCESKLKSVCTFVCFALFLSVSRLFVRTRTVKDKSVLLISWISRKVLSSSLSAMLVKEGVIVIVRTHIIIFIFCNSAFCLNPFFCSFFFPLYPRSLQGGPKIKTMKKTFKGGSVMP